jgi:hypothetical protein
MYRSKSLNYPKIPDTLESLNFFTDACKIFRETVTSKVGDASIPGERFLLFDGWSEIKDTRSGRIKLVPMVLLKHVQFFTSKFILLWHG